MVCLCFCLYRSCTSLVSECDFEHNLTFPQFRRENIPFLVFYSHFYHSPAFSRFSRFFDFSRFLYDYIYFLTNTLMYM